MSNRLLFTKSGTVTPYSFLREYEEFGLRSIDLVSPPRRFWADNQAQGSIVEEGQDLARLTVVSTPAQLLATLPPGDNWQAMSRRSLNRLHAYFLAVEDPQRRMDVREVDTLAHQVSLVRHILESEKLRRVLIADEVGLGKTVEAGLILKELIAQRPALRVLYLAPARLVSNVHREFQRLKLPFRRWTASDADANLTDPLIIASIHRAVVPSNRDKVLNTPSWDVIVVDECHHLSAWSPDGTDARHAYRLVEELISRQQPDGRVILMSGTPHQGHATRFDNLLILLKRKGERTEDLAGRVIYRTKDDIKDWEGNPVFPNRRVNEPLIVDLGPEYRNWLRNIFEFYQPKESKQGGEATRRRAAGWRCAQAMQWATSSPQAGLGYLTRQAIRAGWPKANPALRTALAALRPYRLGPEDENIDTLFNRIVKEVNLQQQSPDNEAVEDLEEEIERGFIPGEPSDPASQRGLERLLREGVELIQTAGNEKLHLIYEKLLQPAGVEKVVLFAQPIETVTAVARYLAQKTGEPPALILGGQSDMERQKEVERFRHPEGPQYLVSSRAGGEGINLQVSRRLIHLDVPWNPMDMEQRVGRVHRFGSRDVVIVDTVVVKDSREWDAYQVAKKKLALITSTLVEAERFESVFSRVMCLLPQEDFLDIMIQSAGSPLSSSDQAKLHELVQQGFRKWKEFHDKYGKENAAIRAQDPGLASWSDLAAFLERNGDAQPTAGFRRQRFSRIGPEVRPIQEQAHVLRLPDGKAYVCDDYGESLVYAPNGNITPKLGLNLPVVADQLRKAAFPAQPAGAAHVRWPEDEPLPPGIPRLPIGILAFVRQTLQADRSLGWVEQRNTLHVYVTQQDEMVEVHGAKKGELIRGLLKATIRKGPDTNTDVTKKLEVAEWELSNTLRRPTQAEHSAQIRHAVTPLLAVVVTA